MAIGHARRRGLGFSGLEFETMKNGKIFLVGKTQHRLLPMKETAYSTEDVLQNLLELYSDLLAGDQIDPEQPRRWLLVSRELGVPDEVDEASRWSLDHL